MVQVHLGLPVPFFNEEELKKSLVLRWKKFLIRIDSEYKIDSHGGVAQLGEHLPCKQGVRSSNLLVSTMFFENCIEDNKIYDLVS